ncbi:DUF1283 domain-containing protein [Serratia sp. M24T3]|uniref:DUF1283 domain-containing protein n=1 Tax=Rouxiella sp. WC2420 TaxID=3234145 RepID=A0AB39VZK6_9GAMM|nr:DUF1283 domain-containing protein [Serratia sp. M24T3]EIC84200.1 hypothetical protein SPM24T3_12921 [Serratia sp. M24T3]
MNTIVKSRLLRRMLPVALLVLSGTWQIAAHAETNCAGGTCVFGGSGNNSLSNEQAQQSKEQWNATRTLRQQRIEIQERDNAKYANAEQLRDRCNASRNLNAYWEPTTSRCLDRRTGNQLLAP